MSKFSNISIFFILLVALSCLDASSSDIDGYHNESMPHKGNILCLMAVASKSHQLWNRSIMAALAQKGYNVTALSIRGKEESNPNLHYLHMEGVYAGLEEFQRNSGDQWPLSLFDYIRFISNFLALNSKLASQSEGFRRLLEYPNDFKFDLVITDSTGLPDVLGFVHKFNYPPVIGTLSLISPIVTMDTTGTPVFPSLIPCHGTDYPSNMSFWQRTKNVVTYVILYFFKHRFINKIDVLAKQVFGDDLPFLGDLIKRTELVLVNYHPSIDYPQLLLPNVIHVGGLHIQEPRTVPKEIDQFFAASKKGVVLFSLGTIVMSPMVGEERLQMFVRAFARLPDYHFLWKIDRTDLNVSENVMTTPWMSQNDVLGHSKMKLFITHNGLLSTQESIWHGVPMIGIPFFGDQFENARKSVDAGIAEKVDIASVTEDKIVDTIKRVLEDPSYERAMSLRSHLFRDRPRHPLQEAVWWCEYVLRNKGAPHLRSQAATMSLFVLFMWDLLLIWTSVLVLTLLIFYWALKRLSCCKMDRMKTSEAIRRNKNK